MLQTPILILDLDNTIYPVTSIGDKLFEPLFELIKRPEYAVAPETLEKARIDIMRVPFQRVAKQYGFPTELTEAALRLLRNLSYKGDMHTFEDYKLIKEYQATRFLVTSGFSKMQQSKISNLAIQNDFEEIFIIDPDFTDKSKKDVFEDILVKYKLDTREVIV